MMALSRAAEPGDAGKQIILGIGAAHEKYALHICKCFARAGYAAAVVSMQEGCQRVVQAQPAPR